MISLRYTVASVVAVFLCSASVAAFAVEGLVTSPSAYSVDTTIERFEAAVKQRGLMVFTRFDHAAAAESVGLNMPRSTVIVFGNPRLGTPVFVKTPTVAIDLPLKAMVWEDERGTVFLSYNSAEYLYGTIYVRHGAQYDQAAVAKLEGVLSAIAGDATR